MKLRLVVFILFLMTMRIPFGYSQPSDIKKPNVSGTFYDSDPTRLSDQIDEFISEARVKPLNQQVQILISPHAGYSYSGPVAAYSYKAVSKGSYKTIVVIAPSHFYGFDGVSIWAGGGFETPLGTIPVDEDFTRQLISANSQFYFKPEVFEREHSLEVELPFLQKTFHDFKIVPIIMGQPALETCRELADMLDKIIGNRDDVLIVVSSDMSHYHTDETARKMDHRTLEAIQSLDIENFWEGSQTRTMEMCGFVPVTTALFYAKKRGLKPHVLRYANSGDVTGDKEQVVGYSSVIFYRDEEKSLQLTLAEKKRLMKIAKEAVKTYLTTGKILNVQETDPRLNQEEGAFVTLHSHGELRGCIGRILGRGPLCLTVRDMAVAAASEDPRFAPVKKEELHDLEFEISVLSRPQEISDVSKIVMGVHGVIVSQGAYHQGVFLPQVATETGWSREQFLSELCRQKAGLPSDAWKDPATKIEIFTAQVFLEKDLTQK